MIRMRQRQEPRREGALRPALVRRHLRERVPRHPGRQFHPDAALNRLAAAHAGTRDRTIAQVVTGGEEAPLTLLDLRFRGAHPREDRPEVFLVHRDVAGYRRLGRRCPTPLHGASTGHHSHDHQPQRQRRRLPMSMRHAHLPCRVNARTPPDAECARSVAAARAISARICKPAERGHGSWTALPILAETFRIRVLAVAVGLQNTHAYVDRDRKSTRLNSSHLVISYAVFCLKKKKYN